MGLAVLEVKVSAQALASTPSPKGSYCHTKNVRSVSVAYRTNFHEKSGLNFLMNPYGNSAGGSIVGPLGILGRAVLVGHGGLGVCAEDVSVAVDLAVVGAAGVGNGVRAGQGLKVKEVLEHFCSRKRKDNRLHFFFYERTSCGQHTAP